jgi:phosphotransferase system enzyme I (PtsI)
VQIIHGFGTSQQVAVGTAVIVTRGRVQLDECPVHTQDPQKETDRLRMALKQSRAQLDHILLEVAGHAPQEHVQILRVHMMLIKDRRWEQQSKKLIEKKGYSAEMAVRQTTLELLSVLQSRDDPYLQQRAIDIEQVNDRILRNLGGVKSIDLSKLPEGAILVSHDLSPAEIVQMDSKQVQGIITDLGGITAHMAIMARAMSIPALVGTGTASQQIRQGDLVILDASTDVAIVSPDPSSLRFFRHKQRLHEAEEKTLAVLRDLPAVTSDGAEIELLANLELPQEQRRMAHYGVTSVGLYRTEYLYTDTSVPSEEEHFRVYRQLLHACAPHPVTIRTSDLGSDKVAPLLDIEVEKNPALGFRGIRCCLAHRELFTPQLRALLRAAAHGHLRILLPMITSAQEVQEVRELLNTVAVDLTAAGIRHGTDVEVGAMIEVPSAVFTCDMIAKEVDFLSIGTNDLVQYMVAADRNNEHVAYLTDPLQPAVLRAIREVVRRGEKEGIPVEVCGEMGGSAFYVPLLMGLGVRAFSMTSHKVPHVKRVVRAIPMAAATRLAQGALRLSDPRVIRDRLEQFCLEYAPEEFATRKFAQAT